MKNLLLILLCLELSALVGCRPRQPAPDAGAGNGAPISASPARDAARAATTAPTPTEALLTRIRNENRAINFVRPAPVSFTWYDAQGAELPAAGAEIAAYVKVAPDYTVLNQHMQTVAEALIREGFARDPYNSTEIVDGLISGNTVAVIRSACPDGDGDCTLTVRIGNLKK